MKFYVARDKWYRRDLIVPDEEYDAYPLNSHGMRCCMGFVCSQLGVPDSELIGVVDPDGLSKPPSILLNDELVSQDWVTRAVRLNDDFDRDRVGNNHFARSQVTREAELTKLFADNGHELVFVETLDQIPGGPV